MELEKNLKEIKDAELDIELLKRENEKKCYDNIIEIAKLTSKIGKIEEELEKDLKESGETRLECKFDGYKGSIGLDEQPDQWIYEDEILMAWIISLPAIFKNLFLKATTTVKKGDLKKQIINDNNILFEKNKLIEDEAEIELFLVNEGRSYKVEGIGIEHQDPKFKYNIKKLKK